MAPGGGGAVLPDLFGVSAEVESVRAKDVEIRKGTKN